MHSHKEFKSWQKVEKDMRAAGYPEVRIQRAKDSYAQGMNLLCRILQRVLRRDEIPENESDDMRDMYKTV